MLPQAGRHTQTHAHVHVHVHFFFFFFFWRGLKLQEVHAERSQSLRLP